MFPWKIAVLLAIPAVAGIYYFYYAKDLASPQKELLRLRLSLLCLIGFFLVGIITAPFFGYYVDTSPTYIQTIDDARFAIQRSNETIKKLADDSRESFWMIFMTSAILIGYVLPSFLRLSEAMIPGESEEPNLDDDRPISIFDDDRS